MVNFIAIDLGLLVLFIVITSIFLYNKRKNLAQDGWLMLYRTKNGLKLINYFGKNYKKTLKFLSYISIGMSYVLMIGITYLIINSVYLYFTTSIATTIKAPPIAPLIPYFPKLFGLQSFFPPFYFIYFIISILIVATVHEFSHGIFARRYGIKIKSTGFAFLKYFPAVFGAFVEQDDKQMNKKGKFEQMSVLSAGVFANIVVGVLFFIIIILYFSAAFNPAGVIFDSYTFTIINASEINSINGISVINPTYDGILKLNLKENELNKFNISGKNYVATKSFLGGQKENKGLLVMYDDSPAINSNLSGAIKNINGVNINSREKLAEELMKHSPGEKINITAISDGKEKNYEITLGERADNKSLPWLGIGFFEKDISGIKKIIYITVFSFKDPNIYYEPNWEFSQFIYDLLWWIIIINLLVGLFNMLPLGILDGGRFFYLTVFGLTKSEKTAKKVFGIVSYFILFLFLILMLKWLFMRF